MSIPKLICLDQNLKELGTWGPRPKFLQDWMYKNKANPKMEMSGAISNLVYER